MSITDYTTLNSAIADHLNRSDLTSAIPVFIQLAEAKLARDSRVRKIKRNAAFSVSVSPTNAPPDFLSLVSLAHVGPTYFGPIEIVGPDEIGKRMAEYGTTGVPRFAAVIDGDFVFAPAPDTSYTLDITYWQTFSPLSDITTTNWLLTSHPDIYLYASLVHSAPYLKDDDRVAVWSTLLESSLEELGRLTSEQRFSGTLVRRPPRVF